MRQKTQELLDIRENVEILDKKLLEMIARRRRLSEKIAAFKRGNQTEVRNFPLEHNRLSHLIEKGRELGIDPFSVSRFYQNIIEDSVLTQHAHLHHLENLKTAPGTPRVAFLGGPGAYSQFAAKKFFSFSKKPLKELGRASFAETLEALKKGTADYAVLPYINSRTGLIEEAVDALLAEEVQAIGEVFLPIEHCLLGQNRDFPVTGLRQIFAHPEVLRQCKDYLNSLKTVELVPLESTYHALKRVADGRVNEAAIGSVVAGNIFDLKAMKTNLQGDRPNYTRFLVVSNKAHKVPGSVEAKTTLAFIPQNNGHGLSEIFLELHDRDIAVSPIESRPAGRDLWERIYLMDILSQPGDEKISSALEVLESKTTFLKILGCYPSGRVNSYFGN